ncbi:MAG TPA: saccharopine dehydrogenase NADP-binding domain-containing protein, partial [Caldilineaceae bacterium]|nr:saccharopine dehydrogenase NADP-binding domain-containing protein [Caldilineaceae bacterium]
MKVMVIGSGLMGPAAAYNALLDPEVEQVTLADMRVDQLERAQAKLARIADISKLCIRQVDLNDRRAAAAAIAAADVVVAALPNRVIPLGLEAAAVARRPWVDLSRPTRDEIERLGAMMAQAGVPVVWGCGLEPGLTEIMARYLAEKLDQV